ncbi:MAG: DNA polymerase III subunit delta [Clostridium sp.]
MITYDVLENDVKKNSLKNSYIFCGLDEELIKEEIKLISKPFITDGLGDLNYIKLDGLTITADDIKNACETMPLMSEKKLVIVYRANFLKEKSDSTGNSIFKEIKEYLKDMPPYTILIMYYIFSDKRETPRKNKKLMSLDKITSIVYFEKLKRDKFNKKVEEIFQEKEGRIGKIELRYFCERVANNFDIVNREIDKLLAYTNGREIKREDINKLLPPKNEEDIFDLVDLISQRKIDKAIDIMDELLFRADQHMLIITSIENQFKRLYKIKIGVINGKKTDDFVKELKLPAFVCEKMINLSNKFSLRQLKELIRLCMKTEEKLKSSSTDKKMELEMLLVETLMIKK